MQKNVDQMSMLIIVIKIHKKFRTCFNVTMTKFQLITGTASGELSDWKNTLVK